MPPRFLDVTDLPSELRVRAEEAQRRLETKTTELRSLDAKIAALDDLDSAPLRKRCRTCQKVVADVFEGVGLALNLLHTTYLRNGAALQTASDREIARMTVEAQRAGQMGLDPQTMKRIGLDLESQVQISSGRVVLESDRFALDDRGKQVRASGSVIDGAIKIATKGREVLIKSRDATVYEIQKAKLPGTLKGAKQDVASLLAQAESRQWVRGLGPREAMKWALAQLDSAIKADDIAHLVRIEAGVGPYAAELTRMGNAKIAAELTAMSNASTIRDGLVSEVTAGAHKVVRVLDELREARAPRDAKLALAIVETCITLWQRTCGLGDVQSMTPQDFRTLLGKNDLGGTMNALVWQVDCSYLLRDALGPAGAAALRQIPSMKAAVQAFDARVLTSMRTGRSQGGSS